MSKTKAAYIGMRLPVKVKEELQKRAKSEGRSLTNYLMRFLTELVEGKQ